MIIQICIYIITFYSFLWFSGKGVGRVQIQPRANLTVDLFVTHTIADSGTTWANNSEYRILQVRELMEERINQSKADAIILGGDLNATPDMTHDAPYEIIQRTMKNSAAEVWHKSEEWLTPKFATYGNEKNSFSYAYNPITYDYIFHKR